MHNFLSKSKSKFLTKILFSIALLSFLSLTLSALAENQTIEMLNKLGKESMVYSKKVVKVDIGDTVYWKSTNPGHNVEFIKGGVPEGVEKFKTKFSKDAQYTFKVPGIYAYWCTPHKSMGMIGFIVVGNDKSNLEAIKKIKYYSKSKKIAPELINSL